MKSKPFSRSTRAPLSLPVVLFRIRRETFKNGFNLLIALLAALILLTLLADHFQLDIRLMAALFDANRGWYIGREQPWYWLYRYGALPGVALGVFGLIGFCLSFKKAAWQGLQRHFLLIVLTLIIGPGLLVNVAFKDHWGRPRPKQIQAFGGSWEYRSVFSPGIPGRGKSFPSGHCAMGYVFFTLVAFRKRSTVLAWVGGLGALIYGTLMGMARMAAGGHFPTDVLWSLGIVIMVITVLYYWVLRIPEFHYVPAEKAVLTGSGRRALQLGTICLLLLLALSCRKPYFSSNSCFFTLADQPERLLVHANVDFSKTNIHYLPGERPRILIKTRGFAYPKAKHCIKHKEERSKGTLHLYHNVVREGYHADLNYTCEVFLPLFCKHNLRVEVDAGH